jgi:hypothetical protein
MELLAVLSAFGLSASAGLNAYIPLLVISLVAKFTNLIHLSSPWDALTSWWIIGLLLLLSVIEFFADKIPAVNHINDVIQTFIRPTAGAVAFAASTSVVSNMSPVFALAMGLLVAGGIHTVKSVAVRPVLTATTGGAANVPVSIAEDLISTVVSILSIVLPVVIACVLILITTWLVTRWIYQARHKSTI